MVCIRILFFILCLLRPTAATSSSNCASTGACDVPPSGDASSMLQTGVLAAEEEEVDTDEESPDVMRGILADEEEGCEVETDEEDELSCKAEQGSEGGSGGSLLESMMQVSGDSKAGACCWEQCASSNDCGKNLFCCPGHKKCMDRSTGSTRGPNCDVCKNGPTPAPAPTKPPVPPPEGTLACGFETGKEKHGDHSGYCQLWEDSTSDDLEWSHKSGRTPSSSTGPEKAKEGSKYLYLEASGKRSGQKAVLQTCHKVKLNAGAFLEFDFHMYGSHMGTLEAFVNTDSVFKMSGNQGNKWQEASVKLDKYAGQEVDIKISASRGSCYRGDIAIDEVNLFPGKDDTPKVCADASPWCGGWASAGECTKNPGWMKVHCRKACGECKGSPGQCTDDNEFCSAWAASGECQKNPMWMNVKCQKSCKTEFCP